MEEEHACYIYEPRALTHSSALCSSRLSGYTNVVGTRETSEKERSMVKVSKFLATSVGKSSEFLLHPIDGANVRETPPLLTAGCETRPRRRGNSLPVSRSACIVSSYASRFRTNLMYQPHIYYHLHITMKQRNVNMKEKHKDLLYPRMNVARARSKNKALCLYCRIFEYIPRIRTGAQWVERRDLYLRISSFW
jgi:hypothetical protein